MIIKRDIHLNRIIARKHNGMIKVITGLRRCGKSYLLFNLFQKHLHESGVDDAHIIKVDLEDRRNLSLRNPDNLLAYIDTKLVDDKMYYVLLDEVQLVPEFEDVLNSFLKVSNADVYVTGSNAKFLSKDVITEFRGRGDEIHITPLSFREFSSVKNGDRETLLYEYMMYGGMPLAVLERDEKEKRKYLQGLFANVYVKDLVERYKLKDDSVLNVLVDVLSSSVGSLTNPNKLANTASSLMGQKPSRNTIKNYLDYLEDAYLFQSAKRWDVKGRKYFDNIQKYYAMDLGLRNARLNFRQQERSHLMENMIYNDLVRRGYSADVGIVEQVRVEDGKRKQSQYEIDFVVNMGNSKVYIQSALNVDTLEKKAQETFSLKNTGDFFRKIVVLDGNCKLWTDEDGVMYVGVIPFLLEDVLGDI